MPNTGVQCTLSLAVVATLLTAPALAFNTWRRGQQTASPYLVILDAGSSGTKINMYQISDNRSAPGDVVQVFRAVKVKPGLHTLQGEGLAAHAANIVSKLNTELDAAGTVSFQSPIPVYLVATAGLRSLEESEADRVLKEAWRKLSESFQQSRFTFPEDNCRMLAGTDEGMYAFLAANFLNGYLKNTAGPVGLLEMGGMSLQVVFPPVDPSQGNCELTAGGHVLQLHAHSYSSFGTSAIAQEMMESVCSKSASGTRPLENPCMLRNDCGNYTCGSSETSVCGGGNPAQCTSSLREVVDRADVGVVDAGPRPFFAISSFRYAPEAMEAIDVSDQNRTLSVSRLGRNAQVYCKKTLSEATGGNKKKEKFASNECREALFIHLLLETLGLQDNTILIQDEMGGKKLNWALGFAVDISLPDVSFRCVQ